MQNLIPTVSINIFQLRDASTTQQTLYKGQLFSPAPSTELMWDSAESSQRSQQAFQFIKCSPLCPHRLISINYTSLPSQSNNPLTDAAPYVILDISEMLSDVFSIRNPTASGPRLTNSCSQHCAFHLHAYCCSTREEPPSPNVILHIILTVLVFRFSSPSLLTSNNLRGVRVA